MNERLADAARSFLGVPFRLHGRDPGHGLDCVGLVAVSLERIGLRVSMPVGYRLYGRHGPRWHGLAEASGLDPVADGGDIWLVAVHPVQNHLMIAAANGAIHAHAGLRRVVFLPGPSPWPIIGRWIVPQHS